MSVYGGYARSGSGRVDFLSTGFAVTEDVEARLAVVGAHAALADAAERQVGDRDVEERRVDARATAARRVRRPGSTTALSLGEDVERQRLVARVDERDRLVGVVDRDHRQHGTEDLLLHHGSIGRDVAKDGRREVPGRGVRLAPDDGGSRIEEPYQTLEMVVVDDARVVGARLRVVAVEVEDRRGG